MAESFKTFPRKDLLPFGKAVLIHCYFVSKIISNTPPTQQTHTLNCTYILLYIVHNICNLIGQIFVRIS